MKPVFRHPDRLQLLSYREFLREHLPTGAEGCVVEDLDLVIRLHGPRYGTDATGKLMLVELKFGNACLDWAQQWTFRLMHQLLRDKDPSRERYLGYFVVNYDNLDWSVANFRVNGKPLTVEQFLAFLQGDIEDIPSLWP
jgi:hypothetical protein